MNSNNNKIIEEGVASVALKTAANVAGKVASRVIPGASKVLSNPAVSRSGTLLAKAAIRSKAFRSFVRMITRSRVVSILKDKRLIQTAVRIGDAALFADLLLDVYDLTSDYISGKYSDVSWESIATAGSLLVYLLYPGEVTSGDEEFDAEVVKVGLDSIDADLKKYKEWKAKQREGDSIEESTLLMEGSKFLQTYFSILIESADSEEERMEAVRKVDPKFAEELKKSVDSSGNVKFSSDSVNRIRGLFAREDAKELESIQGTSREVDSAAVKKVLDSKSEVVSILKEIFSKEALISLIPFSTLPTISDVEAFFEALNCWCKGTYEFDESDRSELISIRS